MLELENLHAWYGKSQVLRGVNLQVGPGEIVSLLGRNGAGRSTALKAVMQLDGIETAGAIRFRGADIHALKTFEIARKGLGYVPESRDVFPTLSVEQNLLLGAPQRRPARWTLDDMYRMFPLLDARRHAAAGVLSGGEQQMLALCRTLMGNPALIMVDEPTEGLAPALVVQVAEQLVMLKEHGISVLLVEQKRAIALDISQRVYVMGRGAIVFEGTPRQLMENTTICQEWLGV